MSKPMITDDQILNIGSAAQWANDEQLIEHARKALSAAPLNANTLVTGALNASQPQEAKPVASEDWQLVPKVAIPEMLSAFYAEPSLAEGWAAMLAAAPQESAPDAAAIRNAALEEAAEICDQSSLQPAIAKRIRALQSQPHQVAPADKESRDLYHQGILEGLEDAARCWDGIPSASGEDIGASIRKLKESQPSPGGEK